MGQYPAGWHPDPTGRFEHRYWDGTTWTDNVSVAGQMHHDPVVTLPEPAAVVAPDPEPEPVPPEPEPVAPPDLAPVPGTLDDVPPPVAPQTVPASHDFFAEGPSARAPGETPTQPVPSANSEPPGPGWWLASDGNWYPPDPDPTSALPLPVPAAGGGSDLSRRTPMLIGAAAAVVAVAVVLFLVLRGGDGSSSSPSSASDTPAVRTPDTSSNSVDSSATVGAEFTMTTPDEVGVKLDKLKDASLAGVGYTLTVERAGLADHVDNVGYNARFGTPVTGFTNRTRLAPPKGKRFVVVRYDLETQNTYGSSAPSVSVEVDDVKYSVDLATGVNTLVATVDKGAKDIGLAVQEPEDSQVVSVRTGKRAGGYPAVLYRSGRRIAVNDTASLPYVMTGPQKSYGLTCGGAGRLDVVLGDAELVWSQRDSKILQNVQLSGALAPPSKGSSAWLVVKINDFNAQSPRYCGKNPKIPPERVALVLPDGSQVTAALATTQYVAFMVPADMTSAQFELRPGDNILDEQSPGHIFNFGGAVAQVPITFSSSAGSATTTTTAP